MRSLVLGCATDAATHAHTWSNSYRSLSVTVTVRERRYICICTYVYNLYYDPSRFQFSFRLVLYFFCILIFFVWWFCGGMCEFCFFFFVNVYMKKEKEKNIYE